MSTAMYRTINPDDFPRNMSITFWDEQQTQTMVYEKVTWTINNEERGLRYGENPDQQAALYRPVNGNLCLGDVECISPGKWLASDLDLLQSGKHPGKINVTDVDSALNILRFLNEDPACVIVKHNNPCGVARGESTANSFKRCYLADRVAAFGGAVAMNREVDAETAEMISAAYVEVVAAPGYAEGVVGMLAKRKNLRIVRVRNMERLRDFRGARVVEYRTLIDGGIVAQWSQVPLAHSPDDYTLASTVSNDQRIEIKRSPRPDELDDMHFGWMVQFGVTSNSVIYVRDGVTIGIGTGEQDRVGVAEIARDKAYRKLADRYAWEQTGRPLLELEESAQTPFRERAVEEHGGLPGAVMVSDAFFPFADGVRVGIREGVTGVIQPGGSMRDREVIEECNKAGVTMLFTGQRNFRH